MALNVAVVGDRQQSTAVSTELRVQHFSPDHFFDHRVERHICDASRVDQGLQHSKKDGACGSMMPRQILLESVEHRAGLRIPNADRSFLVDSALAIQPVGRQDAAPVGTECGLSNLSGGTPKDSPVVPSAAARPNSQRSIDSCGHGLLGADRELGGCDVPLMSLEDGYVLTRTSVPLDGAEGDRC